jgi:N-acyl amino acid synthase of PEP-CTERM/exosortase system
MLAEAYSLRYQVYCVEHQFEDAALFPDNKEIDAYDCRSVHSIVRHRASGITASAVRLVLPDPDNPKALFPIEEHCETSFKQAGIDWRSLPRETMAEISRFAVSKTFKRRVGEVTTVAGVSERTDSYVDINSGDKGRQIPHLTLGLFVAIVKMSAEHGITHWYAVLEPSLLRLLARFGIELTYIGEPVEYHGYRQPCYASIDQVLAEVYKKCPDLWKMATEDGTLWPAPDTTVRGQRGHHVVHCVSEPSPKTSLMTQLLSITATDLSPSAPCCPIG